MNRCPLPPQRRCLRDFFDRVVVLSLPRRSDRRERLIRHLSALGLHRGVEWVAAIDGSAQPPPSDWKGSVGSWGCWQSHLSVLRRALSDGVKEILILEDDAIIASNIVQRLELLMAALPRDWGQFYLGGQHLADPGPTHSPLLWRGTNVNRTHAWAARGGALEAIVDHLSRRDGTLGENQYHVDHHFGSAHGSALWPAFTPAWWLAGQRADASDVNDRPCEEHWWHHPRYATALPLYRVAQDLTLPPDEARRLEFDSDTDRLAAVRDCPIAFRQWRQHLGERALRHGRLPAWRGSLPTALAASVSAGTPCWPFPQPSTLTAQLAAAGPYSFLSQTPTTSTH